MCTWLFKFPCLDSRLSFYVSLLTYFIFFLLGCFLVVVIEALFFLYSRLFLCVSLSKQIFFYPSGFFWLDKELNQHKADLRGGHQSLKTCIYRRLSNKESVCSAGDARDQSSIPGSGRSPGGGHDNLLQHSHWRIPCVPLNY